MPREIHKRVQIVLFIVMFAAGIRLALIMRSRREPARLPAHAPSIKLTADDYVVPRKLHAYDLASLRQLVGKPVWIRAGYQLTYYPYNTAGKRADFNHEAGLMGPIEQVEVKDVVQQPSPESMQWQTVPNSNSNSKIRIHRLSQELLAIFEKEGKTYAFSIGRVVDGDYQILADDLLYYQDPHQLYQHWPSDTWSAIDRHEARAGMNELQVQFAIGVGTLESYGSSERVLRYANAGRPLRVVFVDGKAQSVVGAS
ncbi:MAG TPA: hypothetical protein VK699_17370 [Terriglobales bacterium]|jgi:hypothetical protein|nr:hypothetical protein [Terriglobales bacterium]